MNVVLSVASPIVAVGLWLVPTLTSGEKPGITARPMSGMTSSGEARVPADGIARVNLAVASAATAASSCAGPLRITGSVAFAPPGCGDGSLSVTKSQSTTCSSSGVAHATNDATLAPASEMTCAPRPLRRARVELWSGSTFQVATRTDATGAFDFCLSNDPGNAVDLYPVVVMCPDPTDDGDACRSLPGVAYPFSVAATTPANEIYIIDGSGSVAPNVCVGSVRWDIVDKRPTLNGAEAVYDLLANEAFDRLEQEVGWRNTFDLRARFPASSSGYDPGAGAVGIAPADAQDADLILSNYALFVLHRLYGSRFPLVDCSGHGWAANSSRACAWLFGWAAHLQGVIQDDPIIEDTPAPFAPPIALLDMEPPTPSALGSRQDGAVAATLWDIVDTPGGDDDESLLTFANVWTTVSGRTPADVCELREAIALDYGKTSALATVFERHGIDDCDSIEYVALGDSYSSGEGVVPYEGGTDQGDPGNRCHRSRLAYSAYAKVPGHVVSLAAKSNVGDAARYDFLACSGAETVNVTIMGVPPKLGGGVAPDDVAQLDRSRLSDQKTLVVNEETDLITITIGGNDTGFGPILVKCAVNDSCHDSPTLQGDPRPFAQIVKERIQTHVRSQLAVLYADIKARARNATIVVLGYPYLFRGFWDCDDARTCIPGTQIPMGRISAAEQSFIRDTTDLLNAVIEIEAARAGFHFVPNAISFVRPYLDQEFAGHELCGASDDPWFHPLCAGEPIAAHPTSPGHKRWGDVLNRYLQSVVDDPAGPGVKPNGLPENPIAATADAAAPQAMSAGTLVTLGELALEPTDSQPCSGPKVFVPGGEFTVRGAGFAALAEVSVELVAAGSDVVHALGSLSSDGTGVVEGIFTVPSSLSVPGLVLLQVSGEDALDGMRLLLAHAGVLASLEADDDGDGVAQQCDACPGVGNATQLDSDGDGVGDACDPCPMDSTNDVDHDGRCDGQDPCPLDAFDDLDADGVCGDEDNCPLLANPGQEDRDGDGRGDPCDARSGCALDVDGDGRFDVSTDVVYIARRLLGLGAVPGSFRLLDPSIPPSEAIGGNVDAIRPALDVDMRGATEVSTDVVYLARAGLGLDPVPPSFRATDSTIPPNVALREAIARLCPAAFD